MKHELFQELLESVREAGAVMRGERKAHRERRLELPDVKAILKDLRLSEAQFARLLNVRETTVRNWQQGKRKPAGANFVLLRVAEKHPEALLDAVMA
jgi:putative transcriptional regulator